MRGLAAGDKGYEKYPKLLRDNFICVNVFTTSVEEETQPRGPKGAFQFTDKSVPVLVIKKWDGTTISQDLGFVTNEDIGKKSLAKSLDAAMDKNGPVMPPKLLAPLVRSYDAGVSALKKQKTADAIKSFQEVVKCGDVRKAFPDGPPHVAVDAAERLKEIEKEGEEALDTAKEAASTDAKAAAEAYKKLQAAYKGLSGLEKKIKAAQDALPKE